MRYLFNSTSNYTTVFDKGLFGGNTVSIKFDDKGNLLISAKAPEGHHIEDSRVPPIGASATTKTTLTLTLKPKPKS